MANNEQREQLNAIEAALQAKTNEIREAASDRIEYFQDLLNALGAAHTDATAVLEEMSESIDSLENAFPNGSTQLEGMTESHDQLDSWLSDIENAKATVDDYVSSRQPIAAFLDEVDGFELDI